MKIIIILLIFSTKYITITDELHAQNIYELRKLSEDDWLDMSTEERLNALGTASSHVSNQTFLGDFGRHHDLYKKWGYEYYEMEDRYETYAFRDFISYNYTEARRKRWSYNQFGDRIVKLSPVGQFIWSETYFGDGTMNHDGSHGS